MSIVAGAKIPEATLMQMTDKGPQPVSTSDLFKGKKVVVFAVPGAFTPTCSNQHLPGFVKHAADIRKKGVDTIVCVSVNDAFVMGAWAKDQNVGDSVLMLADGNGDFTRKLGLDLDASGFGMGHRSSRYAMIVDDGVVTYLGREHNPGAVAETGAEKILGLL